MQSSKIISTVTSCLVAQSCLTLATPRTVAHQAPLSMGFSKRTPHPLSPGNQMAAQTSPHSDVPVCGVKEEEKERGPSETRDWRGSMGRAPGLVGIIPPPGGQMNIQVTQGHFWKDCFFPLNCISTFAKPADCA
ncbi:uncharacterized protein LOC122447193 [Cervus canadensis]|uniref:uncharacterized protein LOC122447193 n=1 Tax=Cervus canadensis TaxID=1574408 RepID=UPI001C9E665E|nr:uncharacterized protein LOC122447193 [Cervus canadensis]